MTEKEIKRLVGSLHTALGVKYECAFVRRTDDANGRLCAVVELSDLVKEVSYDTMSKVAAHPGTSDISFEAAYDGGYYPGEGEAVVRLVVGWKH